MFLFIAALVLLFVTGLLTVTDVVSVPLVVAIVVSPFLFFSVLVVVGHSYIYSFDFVRQIVVLHDCHELVNSQNPGRKSYSAWYFLALLQVGVEQLRQKLKNVTLDSFQSLNYKVSGLATARSRLQPYRDALPYSTSRTTAALVSLVYLAFSLMSPAPRYAVARLAGLALSLCSACTPLSLGLFIAIVSILAYPFRKHLARCRAIKHIVGSIYWMLRMISLESDEIYDKDHDFLVDSEPKPEPEVVCVNAGYLPNSEDRQTYIRVTDRPADVSPPKAPSPVRNQSHTGGVPGFRPRARLNLGRLTDEESLRMQETSNKSQVKRAAEKATVARGSIANRSESTPLGGVAPVPIGGVSRFPRSVSLKDNQNACSATAGSQFSRVRNTSNTPGQPIQTPATSSTTSSPSHESLPELVPDADTSDSSSELNTSSDEQCEINNVTI
ncbi:hypothetical protein FRC10_011384, partial [Ceratobasidium sp. 414]